MCSYTVALKIQKDGYTFKNEFTSFHYPDAINTASQRVGTIPYLISPMVGEAITLPLDRYKLDLKTILSIAVLQQSEGQVRYLVPLQGGLTLNHPEDLFRGEGFNSCKLDQHTVVTFDDTWITPSRQTFNNTQQDHPSSTGIWDSQDSRWKNLSTSGPSVHQNN